MILEEVEEIKQLKYKYQRCLDTKDWDGLAETFTKDATTAFSDGQYVFKGVDKIMEFLRSGPLGEEQMAGGSHFDAVEYPDIPGLSKQCAGPDGRHRGVVSSLAGRDHHQPR